MDSQSYDTSRLFATESDLGPSCGYNCPSCDCDGRDKGDTWYVEYQDSYDNINNYASCALCECKMDYDGNKYADCEYVDGHVAGGLSSCSNDIVDGYQCHWSETYTGKKETHLLYNFFNHNKIR